MSAERPAHRLLEESPLVCCVSDQAHADTQLADATHLIEKNVGSNTIIHLETTIIDKLTHLSSAVYDEFITIFLPALLNIQHLLCTQQLCFCSAGAFFRRAVSL